MRVAKVERKIEYFPCIGGEIKEFNDKKGTFGGYLNYKNNIDFGDDRTMNGAFRKTLQDSYARKAAQSLDYIYPYLWNHDYSQMPPGGIYDADEDKKGFYTWTQINLDMEMGRDLYSSLKMGTLRKQSMGYKCIQAEYVKDEATGRTIRNLLEVAVMEGSCVVFPMNDMAQVDVVKNQIWTPNRSVFAMPTLKEMGAVINTKGSASGKTTWPLAERGVPWDKGSAHKDIMAYATSGDGTVDWSKAAECHFWVAKSPPENWGDCKFPFTAKSGGSMKAIPAAIFNGAARLDSANIDDVDGVKAKMAVYYRKMKAPIPWEKGNTMDIWSKDYLTSYQETMQQDWVSDLWNLWYPLRNEIIQAFVTGDTPADDVQAAVKQFGAAVLAYVQRGIELNMTECLQPSDDDSNSPMPMTMMSADDNPETKDAKLLSAASHAKLTKAVDSAMGHMKEMKSELARQRANALQGYQVYGDDDPVPEQKEGDEEPKPKEEQETDEHLLVHDLKLLLASDNANRGV
jgi:HK97 family phage prohead protease